MSIAAIPAELGPLELLLTPLRAALREQTVVLAQGMWQSFDLVGLLPFLLHTVWADRVPELGLNATLAVIPFTPADHQVAKAPFCDPAEAHRARYRARAFRNQSRTDLPSDFKHPDWEQGFTNHEAELAGTPLPAMAYLALDQVGADGFLQRGRRPVLGKYAVGSSRRLTESPPRPNLLIPGRRLTPAACTRLVESDLLIVNVQGTRGARLLESIRYAVQIRGWHRPTLVVASTPSDAVALDIQELPNQGKIISVGSCPDAPRVDVIVVCKERPQSEKVFQFGLLELRGFSPTVDRLVDLGVSAWWRVQQSLSPLLDDEPAARRFILALEQSAMAGHGEAELFTAFRNLLDQTAKDRARIAERVEAIYSTVDSYLNLSSSDSAVVVVRPKASVLALQDYIASKWGLNATELSSLGLTIISDIRGVPTEPGLLVLNGFWGAPTIDAILMSRTKRAALVMDPIEARAMVGIADRMNGWLGAAHVENSPLPSLRAAADARAAAPAGSSVRIGIDYAEVAPPAAASGASRQPALVGRNRAIVFFTDGTFEECDSAKRFDLVNPGMGRLKTASAKDLEPGDEVVLTGDATQFSERLIASLDAGILAKQAAERATWSSTVQAVARARKLKITAVFRDLRERGVYVDYQTVRAWLRGRGDQDAVPDKWEHFRELGEVIGLTLPEQEQRETYAAIRRLRVLHRKAGRDLVRLMRGAATHRLDAVTLSRVQAVWGMTVRELIEGTRIAVVDDVQHDDGT